MNRNYVKGRNFEYRVQNFLRKLGYYVIRAYASKGLYDLIAVPPLPKNRTLLDLHWLNYPLLIQCKYNGYVPPKELAKLKEHDKWQGFPLIASSIKKNLFSKVFQVRLST